ncbi:MAG: Crp/Fnr family transcriptional regulator [Calditrichaeota bacterium]|nr:Crp/Fnr family transcriptional regulator [Calditrichota bacterium]
MESQLQSNHTPPSLRTLPLFATCPADEMGALEQRARYRQFRGGEVIFREGEPAEDIFCICRGKVKLIKGNPHQRERIVAFAGNGEVIGLRCLLGFQKFDKTAIALEPTAGYFLSKSDLLRLFRKHPDLIIKLMKQIIYHLEEIDERIVEVTSKKMAQRLAETILYLQSTFGVDADGNINIRVGRKDLANFIHSNRYTVYRLLAEFRNKGIIEFDRKRLKILDPEKLAEIARK